MKRIQGWTIFISLFAAWTPQFLFSNQNVESSLGWDGAGRWRTYGIVRYGKWSFGISALLLPDSGGRMMIGVNSPWLTLGRLSDAGLAAEVRNPGYSALPRIAERTVYRADLRSASPSRFGTAVHHPEGRYGVGWEKRSTGEYAVIWALPLTVGDWSVELLTQGGIRRFSGGDDGWYPETQGNSGGPVGIAAARLRNTSGPWVWGVTALGSGGASYRPGGLFAGSAMFVRGPWRFRVRGAWGSDFFRNADGKKVSNSRGIAGDALYRPGDGLQAALGYRTPYSSPPGTAMETDKSTIVVGWRSDGWQVRLDAGLERVLLNPPGNSGEALSFFGAELRVDGAIAGLRIRWAWRFPDDQSVRLGGRMRLGSLWSWNLVWKAHWTDSETLWDLRLRSDLFLARNRLSFVVFFGDIPRDWAGGPSGAGDCDVQLTWSVEYGD